MGTSPETPSWEKTRQGVPSVEETFAAEKQDEHHDEEQLVHHRAEEYGMESDPAHQMMNNYVPGWIHEATHSTGGLHGDRIALVAIVALTLLLHPPHQLLHGQERQGGATNPPTRRYGQKTFCQQQRTSSVKERGG